MEQYFELVGVVKSLKLQLHESIQWICIKVCQLKNVNTSVALVPQFVGFSCFNKVTTFVNAVRNDLNGFKRNANVFSLKLSSMSAASATICVNGELIGTHGRAFEWAHPRPPRPSYPKPGAEQSPFEIAAKLLEIDLMCQ